MKVLIDHSMPFILAHGGVQVQIEQTKAALGEIGVEVEYVRWWDPSQTGDLIHFFSVPSALYLSQAEDRRFPVVMTALFSEACNRPRWRLRLQGALVNTVMSLPLGRGIQRQLYWSSYRTCPKLIVGLEAEKAVLTAGFGVTADRVVVVPLGLPDLFRTPAAQAGESKEEHLISTGAITPAKNTVALAHLARKAEVPVLFVGKPFQGENAYNKEFESLIDQRWVKHQTHVPPAELAGLMRRARGFVLFSQYENWSLAASEAVACGLPLLLPDLPWARERFGDQAHYLIPGGGDTNVERLRAFHRDCPKLSPPQVTLPSWKDVAEKLRNVYDGILRSHSNHIPSRM